VKFVEVALALPLRQVFDYAWADHLPEPKLGQRVLVPFRRQKISGVLVRCKDDSAFANVRAVLEVLDARPLFQTELLQLARWVAEYYFCSWGDVLNGAVPGGIGVHVQTEYHWRTRPDNVCELSVALQAVVAPEQWTEQAWRFARPKADDEILRQAWLREGQLEVQRHLVQHKVQAKMERWVRLLQLPAEATGKSARRKTKKQLLLERLQDVSEIRWLTLRDEIKAPASILRELEKAQCIEVFEKRVFRRFLTSDLPPKEPFQTLNSEQRQAFRDIVTNLSQKKYQAFLLHGVTGSGKTEVYLHAVQACIQAKKTALVLVPEIALTPQLVNRFRARFGDDVALLHSGMDDGERFDEWSRLQLGQAHIAIGARSAVFAPLQNIGLIIVDEEHDPSYKQGEAPRYHGRDVAIYRGFCNQATVVLGSATPALESYHNAQQGKYHLLTLAQRAQATSQLPAVRLLDMRTATRQQGCYFFSSELVESMRQRLLRQEQVILFLNRRGYAPVVQCPDCETSVNCPACSLSLVYHQSTAQLQCHQCDFTMNFPRQCPTCGNQVPMKLLGTGTEQIEADVRVVFPEARILRIDRDTLHGKHALTEMTRQIAAHEVDIVIGTQLVTKGHDFPNVTLVGVLLADLSLNMPDFRSAERTFQLLTQVAGRAGRGEKAGEVLIQTNNPQHHSLLCAAQHDYEAFVQTEFPLRERLRHPPFLKLALALISGPNEDRVQQHAEQLARNLRHGFAGQLLLQGPAEAPLAKVNNRFRWMILVKADSAQRLRQAFEVSLTHPTPLSLGRDEHIAIDLDAQHLM
jgi:primosomal protein N' (replication factor Y)